MRLLTHPEGQSKKTRRVSSFVLLITLLTLLLSACGSPQTEQQANKSKAELDSQIAHARSAGIADSTLQPIVNQEKNLSQTNTPSTLFSNQPATNYYQNLPKRYQILTVQVPGLKDQVTQKLSYQAVQNLQGFQTILTQRQTQACVEVSTFSNLYHIYRKQLIQAQYPKDYANISNKAQDDTQSLQLLATALDKLNTFTNLISLLQNSNMDTSALDRQVNSDVALRRSATTTSAF